MKTKQEQIAFLFAERYPLFEARVFEGKLVVAKRVSTNGRAVGFSEPNKYLAELQSLAESDPDELDARACKLFEDKEEAQNRLIYGDPATPEDFDRWAQWRIWSFDAAILLLLGRNPDRADLKAVGRANNSTAFSRLFTQTRAIAFTHMGFMLSPQTKPAQLLQWAKSYEKPIPPDLEASVKKYWEVADWELECKKAMQGMSTYKAMQEATHRHNQEMLAQLRKAAEGAAAQQKHIANLETQVRTLSDLVRKKAERIEQLESMQRVSQAPATTQEREEDPASYISRTSIESMFPEIAEDQWRGIWGREKQTPAISAARRSPPKASPVLYEPELFARALANIRSEVTLADALARVRGEQAAPESAPQTLAFSNPFRRSPTR